MDRIDGRPVYSATDLVAYLACEHLTQLERAALAGLVKRPMRDDPELDVIRKRGFQHEARFLADLRAEGRVAVEIEQDGSIRGSRRRSSAPPRRDDRGDGRRAPTSSTRRRSSTARSAATPTSSSGSTSPGPPVALGPVPLRGGGHEARPPRQGERRSSRSARTSTSSSGSRASGRSGSTSRSAAAPGAVERLRVDDYMAYYRSARDRFLATLADETPPTYPPAATYPEPVEHCDVCRWAAECVDPSPRGRSPEPRRRDLGAPAAGADGPRRRDARGARRPRPADGAAARRTSAKARSCASASRPGSSSRAGATGTLKYELFLPDAGRARSSSSVGWPRCRRRRRATCSSTSRAIRTPSTTGSTTCSALLETDGTFHAIWSRDDGGEFSLDGERRGVRAADRLHHRAPRRATRRCTSTTTRHTSRPRSSG